MTLNLDKLWFSCAPENHVNDLSTLRNPSLLADGNSWRLKTLIAHYEGTGNSFNQ